MDAGYFDKNFFPDYYWPETNWFFPMATSELSLPAGRYVVVESENRVTIVPVDSTE